MVIKMLGEPGTTAYVAALELIKRRGHAIDDGTYYYIDLAVAPLLTAILMPEELSEPNIGTIIFHPSPLPYGRGASSLKYAYQRAEPVTAATWFWADAGVDSGDICEQEILKIDHTMRPRAFYEAEVIPAMLRTLGRALDNISSGIIRRIPQVERYATYDKRM